MGKLSETIFLVDDDAAVLKAIARLLASQGWLTRTYRSAKDFLAEHDEHLPGCIVLDLLMPEMTGLDLQTELVRLGKTRPIVFLSGRASIPTSVQAMKSGAIDFLTKPVDADALIDAVRRALETDAARRATASQLRDVQERFSKLTARERQVVDGVIAGLLNKQIAGRLGIVEKTVKVHRARAVTKLGARTTAELVRMAQILSGAARDIQTATVERFHSEHAGR